MANVGMSTAQGVLGGAGTGASIGTTFGPIGAGVGAVLGGIVGGISGNKKAKDINKAMTELQAVPGVDPSQLAFKDQLAREKKAVDSGFSTDFQIARDIIGQSEAGGMSVAAQMAQTNPALALMAMNQVGNQTDMSVNKALGTISTRGMGYTSMMADLVDKMSARDIQVNLLKANAGLGLATKEMTDFNTNMNAGMMQLGTLADIKFPGLGSTKPPSIGTPLPVGTVNYE
jgi:hypothetical protein